MVPSQRQVPVSMPLGRMQLDMPQEMISAHSVAEAYLYVLVTPCSICKHGAVQACAPKSGGAEGVITIVGTCRNCGATTERLFKAPGLPQPVDPLSDAAPISRAAEPSRCIDVAQWLTLHQLMLESVEETPDRLERRWRRFRAGQCLEEALKFYSPDSDVPPASAFFTPVSHTAYRDHPHRFAKQRLQELRARLPDVEVEAKVGRQRAQRSAKRPWWRFW